MRRLLALSLIVVGLLVVGCGGGSSSLLEGWKEDPILQPLGTDTTSVDFFFNQNLNVGYDVRNGKIVEAIDPYNGRSWEVAGIRNGMSLKDVQKVLGEGSVSSGGRYSVLFYESPASKDGRIRLDFYMVGDKGPVITFMAYWFPE